MNLLTSLLPIILALIGGCFVGRLLPDAPRRGISRLITPLVWLLLCLIGMEFGLVLSSAHAMGHVLHTAMVFASTTTLLPFVLISLILRRAPGKPPTPHRSGLAALHAPVKECLIALTMVATGVCMQWLTPGLHTWLPTSWNVLLLLIVLIGADLSHARLPGPLWSVRALSLPLLVVAGSLLGACLAAWVTGEHLPVALALSSGFGWFSLSSVMIGDALGRDYGAIALLTDLLRELLAIMLLYMLGARYPLPAIGSAGATALDTTLPIVRQACAADVVPLAIISGLLLTVLAPLMIMIFLA